jgi:DNA-binding CsgD family transcriptional regulator
MPSEIVGREPELATVRAFIGDADEGPVALVLEGEAGIGKSTLWLAALEYARERGLRVLSSRPAEAERGLAYVGLGDLLEGVLDHVLPTLSAPRRLALETALLVEEAPAEGVDPRALGVAVRSSLQLLTEERPLVVAIDDVQWLDTSSADTLAFALRRVGESPVLLLLARRLFEGGEPSAVERALDPKSIRRVDIGPLSIGALHRLLRDRLDRVFARQTLLHIHERSGGNPFYALELARALGEEVDPLEPLPVPETLEELVRGRIAALPASTRAALAAASALGRPSLAVLQSAGFAETAFVPAFEGHVLERVGDTIEFTHPLLASFLYRGLAPPARRRVHRRLADVVADPIARARHLALASDEPDEATAGVLEEAAAAAKSRGAPIAAAELGEHALRLSPPDADRDLQRRAIELARTHLAAGNVPRARLLAEELVRRSPHGSARAEALMVLGEAEPEVGAQRRLFEDALREAAGKPRLQALIHRWLTWIAWDTAGPRVGERRARTFLDLAEQLGDDALRAGALAEVAAHRFGGGKRGALGLAEEASALADVGADSEQRLFTGLWLAAMLAWSGRLDRARARLEDLYEEWSERDETALWPILERLGQVELLAGRFSLAAEHVEHAREIDLQYARQKTSDSLAWLVASIAAHRGDLERARALAERGRALAAEDRGTGARCEGVLGLVDLWTEEPRSAALHLAAAEGVYRDLGVGEPSLYWWRRDYVETLLELSRIEEAEEVLDGWEADARRLGRERVLAQATSCRGLVAAARHDVEHALSKLEQAVREHEAVGDRFGRARTLLTLGAVRRKARQKRAAREVIEAALAAFEELGASGWAATASRELGRIGGRTREEGLTAAERRVADLVAEGRTNREVAAALFLAERTVAGHLTHVYAKLGVRSRGELARRLS